MKKLFTILAAVLVSVSMFAATPDLESKDWGSGDFSTVIDDHDGIELITSATAWTGNFSGTQYISTNSVDFSAETISGYFGVKATSVIDSIEIYWATNNYNKTDVHNLAWVGWNNAANVLTENVDCYGLTANYSEGQKTLDDAIWQKIDLSEKEVKAIVLGRQIKKAKYDGKTVSNFGANKTNNILGVRVWLRGETSTYKVTYKANNGTEEADIVDDDAAKVAACTFTAPANHYFVGWNTEAGGTGEEYAVNDKVESDLILYAQWAEITTCANLVPSTSETGALADNAEVVLTNESEGGKMVVVAGSTIEYSTYGLIFKTNSSSKVNVTLDNYMQAGTTITAVLWSNDTGSARTLKLNNESGTTKDTWSFTPASGSGEEKEFTYTVKAGDGLAGAYKFQLQRGSNIYLRSISVSACGEEVPSYTITVADTIKNGTMTVNTNTAHPGEKIVVTATPDAGYFTALVLAVGLPEAQQRLDISGAEISFTMPSANVVVTGEFTQSGWPTAVDNTVDNAKAIKTIENGQLVIIKNGVRYNVLGAELR